MGWDEGWIRDHGQDVARRRLEHHDRAILVGARRQRRQSLFRHVLQRRLDGEGHIVSGPRLLLPEEQLAQGLWRLLVGAEE